MSWIFSNPNSRGPNELQWIGLGVEEYPSGVTWQGLPCMYYVVKSEGSQSLEICLHLSIFVTLSPFR